MASKLLKPSDWVGMPWMEVLLNLGLACRERSIVSRASIQSFTTKATYQVHLHNLSRILKKLAFRSFFNHVRGLSHVQGAISTDIASVAWTMTDLIADIGDAEFYDYENKVLGNDSYRDMEYVLIQYYEIIIRLKQPIVGLVSGNFSEGGSYYYHPWRDRGVYEKSGTEGTFEHQCPRIIGREYSGIYTGTSSPGTSWAWPDNPNYGTAINKDTNHNADYQNLYQFLPVDGGGNTMITAPLGPVPGFEYGPFFDIFRYARFRMRASGISSPLTKYNQDGAYTIIKTTFEYNYNTGSLASVTGRAKSLRYGYTCIHETDGSLNAPWADGETGFYEIPLLSQDAFSIELLFGEHTAKPAAPDIPMKAGLGISPYQGYHLYDLGYWAWMVEIWDDGTDGAFEYYET